MEALHDVINDIGHFLHKANFFLGCTSAIVNFFHLLVLTRKSMKTTSTNILLLGIAISDFCAVSCTIYKHYGLKDVENPECVTSNYLLKVYLDIAAWSVQEHFRRCSSWLGVLMATVRVLVLKLPTQKRYSHPNFGWVIIVIVFAISGCLSFFYQTRFTVIEFKSFALPIGCSEYQNISSVPRFSLTLTEFFYLDNQIVLRIYLMFDAIVTKFIPCICFPILSSILLRELARLKKNEAVVQRKSSVAQKEKNELATKLIVLMTIAFFIAEAPLGMIYLVKVFFNRSDGVTLLSVDIVIYFTVLLTANTISHSVFCVCLSSQYRDTIRRMLGVHDHPKNVRNKASVVSVGMT